MNATQDAITSPGSQGNDGSDPERNEAVEMDDPNPTVKALTQTRQTEARSLNLAA